MSAQVTAEPARPCRASPQLFEHSFAADPHAVRSALRAALARFVRQLSPDEAGTLELVLAEVMNNIVEHGYAGNDAGIITLSIVRDSRGLSCSVSDDGVPLPSACLAPPCLPQTDCSPEDMPEGGFGWFLIRDLTRDLGYYRDRDQNLLAFCLPLAAEPGAT